MFDGHQWLQLPFVDLPFPHRLDSVQQLTDALVSGNGKFIAASTVTLPA